MNSSPAGVATAERTLRVLQADERVAGTVRLRHGHLRGVGCGCSLEVHLEFRHHGHGRAAVAVGERVTRAAGDRALTFNVFGFGGNELAMSLSTATRYHVLDEAHSVNLNAGVDAQARPTRRGKRAAPKKMTSRQAATADHQVPEPCPPRGPAWVFACWLRAGPRSRASLCIRCEDIIELFEAPQFLGVGAAHSSLQRGDKDCHNHGAGEHRQPQSVCHYFPQ